MMMFIILQVKRLCKGPHNHRSAGLPSHPWLTASSHPIHMLICGFIRHSSSPSDAPKGLLALPLPLTLPLAIALTLPWAAAFFLQPEPLPLPLLPMAQPVWGGEQAWQQS
eukprot:1150656-Pelagomonas_calceolata.AAC.3